MDITLTGIAFVVQTSDGYEVHRKDRDGYEHTIYSALSLELAKHLSQSASVTEEMCHICSQHLNISNEIDHENPTI